MRTLLNVDEKKLTFLRYCEGVGGAPLFKGPKKTKAALLERMQWIAGMFLIDGSYYFYSKDIEEYALCLNHDDLPDEAYDIFSAIIGDKKKDILFVSQDERYPFDPLARQTGKLGYESLFLYAVLCLNKGQKEKAVQLFAEIVSKIPTKCYPIRVQDVRVDSIRHLLDIQKSNFPKRKFKKYLKINLVEELIAAEAHQY
jgi:hypothetical protein